MCRCRFGNPKKKSQFYCLKHLGINHLGEGIQRTQPRETWHIKDLYCPVCNETVKGLEIKRDEFEKTTTMKIKRFAELIKDN